MKAQSPITVSGLAVLAMFMGTTAKADLSDGLVAYYPFNGSASDASGNGHDGVVHGATLTTDRFGNPNRAYSFDGTDDYISVAYTPSFQLSAFTISAWIQPTIDARPQPSYYAAVIAARGEDAFTDNLWGAFEIHSQTCPYGTGVSFFYEGNADNEQAYGTTVFPQPETWALVAVTRSLAGELTIYDNGSVIGHWYGTVTPSTQVTRELTIGVRYYNAYSEPYQVVGFFPGSMDDVRLYDRPLNAEEVSELAGVPGPVQPVSVPPAVLLGAIGLAYSGWRLRRKTC